LVRLSRTAKRFRDASFAKSFPDTAACRWTQSFHDIFSNPFHNSVLTTFHAPRTRSCEGMSACESVGIRDEGDIKLRMKSFSQPQQRQHRVVGGCQMSPQVKHSIPARRNFPQDLLGREAPKQLVGPIDLGLPGFQRERNARGVVCHAAISFNH